MTETFDIDILKYVRVIAKRKGLIIAVTLLCLMVAKVATDQIKPVYEASAELLVYQSNTVPTDRQPGDSYQAVLMSEKLTNTFSEMLKERSTAQQVIRRLNLSVSSEDLVQKIDAKPIKDTQLIRVTARDTNPGRAQQIVNTMGDVFAKTVKEIGTPPSTFYISVKLVEPAMRPIEPIAPKPMLNMIIAILFGLTTSASMAFVLERLDVSVKSPEETEKLTGMVSLGKIPLVKGKDLAVDLSSNSSIAEAFRSLRTNIQYLNFDQSARVITITSPGPMEGKTTLAVNLGAVLAQAGNKVLIVDCDLRRPRIHELLQLSNEAGISNVLVGSVVVAKALQQGSIENLSVLTSGPIPPNPADLLNSGRMDELLAEARKEFDYIILDSPPILAVTDASILASKTDGVLLAAIFGRTNKEALVASKAMLERIKARILGFVISGVKSQHGYNYSYYYGTGTSGGHGNRSAKRVLATAILVITVTGFMFYMFKTL